MLKLKARTQRKANRHGGQRIEPQRRWYAAHMKIIAFLEHLPAHQSLRVRGEDLLSEPDESLREIAGRLGLRTDEQAIEAMKHPERSPYGSFGPDGARGGTDPKFMESPGLRPVAGVDELTLDGPLSWERHGNGFWPEVRALAREFGYR